MIWLCLRCSLAWFPGRDVVWWELRHTPFLDHLEEAFARDKEKYQAWLRDQRAVNPHHQKR